MENTRKKYKLSVDRFMFVPSAQDADLFRLVWNVDHTSPEL